MKKLVKWLAVGFVGLIAIAAIAGGGGSKKSGTDTNADVGTTDSTSKPKSSKKSSDCTNRATDNCTPHVQMGKRVRVDALYWDVTSVDTAASIGDKTYGLGKDANGVFVIVGLKVQSDRNESATLTDEVVQLEINGNKYKADSDGTVASIGDGQDPLWFNDIGPDVSMTSKVVFDVPQSALGKSASVRFGELGLGQTHGYIDLSSL